ncbi:M48 family metallopeptidase [methanotrophic endosymbiont of Bathymodiolus puteoserpentis (Logatchev)]|jgi:predicted Zn-dependent protease|uniref:M48 family metallopeptidase n=1 Tax=methanotrophic endosymbiont of Bathymodiolus puteoserpentis (Logatchev) TaxID=343235 RepID=UPI00157A2DC3|nr:M48 family metallopeptidase [methanotrophic endosymbiont of Bathymodiolus puteoserpentis (Logatchev)]
MKKITLLIYILPLLTACATSPLGRSQLILMPDDEINTMGVQAFTQIKEKQPTSKNKTANDFVNCVANALLKEVGGDWELVVFEDKTANAFALPGNKIGVHTGLIDLVDNADQLAAVIGHEIGHVLAHHGNERMSQEMAVQQSLSITQAIFAPTSTLGQTAMSALGLGAQYGVVLPFSRLHESEADIIGLNLMAQAGFNPQESINLWVKMGQASAGQNPPEFMSTHPTSSTRIKDLKKNMPQALQTQKAAIAAGKRPQCVK